MSQSSISTVIDARPCGCGTWKIIVEGCEHEANVVFSDKNIFGYLPLWNKLSFACNLLIIGFLVSTLSPKPLTEATIVFFVHTYMGSFKRLVCRRPIWQFAFYCSINQFYIDVAHSILTPSVLNHSFCHYILCSLDNIFIKIQINTRLKLCLEKFVKCVET